MNLLRHPRHVFLRRTIVLGTSVFMASMIAGIALMFWWDNEFPKTQSSLVSRLLLHAVVGPIYMGLAFLWPITLPVMFVLVIVAFIGAQLKRVWLSLVAFLLMGVYWLWMVKLIVDGAFD